MVLRLRGDKRAILVVMTMRFFPRQAEAKFVTLDSDDVRHWRVPVYSRRRVPNCRRSFGLLGETGLANDLERALSHRRDAQERSAGSRAGRIVGASTTRRRNVRDVGARER